MDRFKVVHSTIPGEFDIEIHDADGISVTINAIDSYELQKLANEISKVSADQER